MSLHSASNRYEDLFQGRETKITNRQKLLSNGHVYLPINKLTKLGHIVLVIFPITAHST